MELEFKGKETDVQHPCGRRGVGLEKPGENLGGVHDPCPTTACPGTPIKLERLIERAAKGLSLFHPRDARVSD